MMILAAIFLAAGGYSFLGLESRRRMRETKYWTWHMAAGVAISSCSGCTC